MPAFEFSHETATHRTQYIRGQGSLSAVAQSASSTRALLGVTANNTTWQMDMFIVCFNILHGNTLYLNLSILIFSSLLCSRNMPAC